MSEQRKNPREASRDPAVAAQSMRQSVNAAARALKDAGSLPQHDWDKVALELAQMRPVLDQLIVLTARDQAPARQQAPVSLGDLLRGAAASVLPLAHATGREVQLDISEGVTFPGFHDELHEAIRSLLESSLAMGSDAVRVRTRIEQDAGNSPRILTEILNKSLDVPASVRKKLTKAIGLHGGQTSFVSAQAGSRVEIRIPMEDRAGAEARPQAA